MLIVSLCLATLVADQEPMASPIVDGLRLTVSQSSEVQPHKKDPKHGQPYPLRATVSHQEDVRFAVWSQVPAAPVVTGRSAGQFLARLYDYNMTKLRLDHNHLYGQQRIDVYLSNEGQGGGEQLFGEDTADRDQSGRATKYSAVYIYDVDTLTDRLEACRELAHEYGHATLPPVLIPGGREQWANGHLGERLYLSWIESEARAGRLGSEDLMGTEASELAAYVAVKVKPLVTALAKRGPQPVVLKSNGEAAFNEYLALACYAQASLPESVLRRSLVLNANQTAIGYFESLLSAVGELKTVPVKNPLGTRVDFWVPLGSGKLSGAKVLAKSNGWAKVRPSGPVTVTNIVKD